MTKDADEGKTADTRLGRNMVAFVNGAGWLVGCAAVHQTTGPDTHPQQRESPVASRRHAATGPVFVDTSGRRQRRVRRLGLLLAVPAVAYIAVLVSALLGGPGASSAYLPLPDSAEHHPRGPASGAPQRAGDDPGRPEPASSAVPENPSGAASRTPASAPRPGTSATAPPSPGASSAPSAAKTTPAPAATRGRSTTTHPAPARSTARGRD